MSPNSNRQILSKDRLTFDSATHVYKLYGVELLSVTQIIKQAGLIDDRFFTAVGADLGSKVHLACQFDDEGTLDYASLAEEIKPRLEAWRRFKQNSKFRHEQIEQIVYHKRLHYAGTLDRFGIMPTVNGDIKNVLLDIKSESVAAWHGLQLAAYMMCMPISAQGATRLTVHLKKDGKYFVREHKNTTDSDVFLSALTIVNWKRICQKNPSSVT